MSNTSIQRANANFRRYIDKVMEANSKAHNKAKQEIEEAKEKL